MRFVALFMKKNFYNPIRACLVLASLLVACQVKALKPTSSNPVSLASASMSGGSVSTQLTSPGSSSFTFTLDEPCKTSAGVFKPDGTLIRTLWSKVRYPAGANSAVWDGLDDNSNAAPAGVYQFKLLQHNTEYVWDGAIGNTSAELSGPTVHHGFWPMRGMAVSGTNGYYVSGYNEGSYDFRNFLTTDPQRVKMAWYWVYSPQFNRVGSFPGDVNDLNWLWVAADANRVYFACSATPNPANLSTPNNYPGCVIACNVGDNRPANFANGVQIANIGANSPLPNGIYVGTQPGLSGLTVQQNGNLLAVSVAADNRVYLMDKLTGSALGNFAVSSPGRLSFSPDGSLWVISRTSVIRFIDPGASASTALTIPNLSKPLDVAVNPANPNLILVADGGASQQLKAFDSTGAGLWTYGLEGGYQSNGVAVSTNKFWFFDGENDGTFLCFAPDGSFWVGDAGNHRSLHFSAALNYLEQIMYQPHSYVACVDQNNSSRVFNQFLEFSVDYTKPLPQAWTLVNNWKANVPPVNISWNEGIYEVTTFPNGRTYGLIDDNSNQFARSQLCELAANQLRLTGLYPAWSPNRGWISLGPDGSARRTTIGSATWYESTLSGFDANNNPIWNPETLIASASEGSTDPVPRCCSLGNIHASISSSDVLISFDQSLNNGWHLGGVRVGSTNWLWKASPAVTWMDGRGTYEIANGVQYAGNSVQALDRQVIFGYHGEFFRNQGQAGQNMHFYDDGLFVGQFGESSIGHSAYEGTVPAKAGNGGCPSLIKSANGDYYLWVNDEAAHGPQRWHFVNARNIREQIGIGTLGSAVTLTNQAYDFPAGLVAKSGNQTAELSWLPVRGAASYNIRYSLMNGGPYSTLVGNTTRTNYVPGGLTNGQIYYFAVSAVFAGAEGTPSEQVDIHPFDTSQTVLCTGAMAEGGQSTPVIEVSSSAAASGQPSYAGAEHLTGVLNLRELDDYGFGNLANETVGTKGYVIYGWGGAGTSLANIPSTFTVTPNTGWSVISYLGRQYRVDNVLGANSGATASPLGSIAIGASDTNFHYLTVVSPAQFNNARRFRLGITSPNSSSVQYSVDESPGYSHVFQFLFRGNITLWANAAGGSDAIVQALFLDDAAVTYAAPTTLSFGPSRTTINSLQNPVQAGSMVTFTATVSGTGGTPTGVVTFFDGSGRLGTASLNSSGVALFSTSALSASGSPHLITAAYAGDNTFSASTSSVLSQLITNRSSATATTVASSQNPALAGSVVTFTATVSGPGGTPTGAVTFFDGNSSFGTATLNSSGLAALSASILSADGSPHSIIATYAGDNLFTASSSSVLSQVITNQNSANPATTPITLINPSFETPNGPQGTAAGVPVGWVASNRNPFGVYNPAAGNYQNTSNDILPSPAQGSQVLWIQAGNYVSQFLTNTLSASQTCTLSGAIGNRGDGYGIQLPSDQEYVYLLAGNSIIAKNENLPHPAPGNFLPWTISYTAPASGFPTGPLEIRLGQSGAGQVHFDNIKLTTSSGTPTTITISQSTTVLASSQNPAVAGSVLTFTATVSGTGGTPTGLVTFFDGISNLGTANLNSSGLAAFSTSALSASGSPHSITAVYAGDSAFGPSTSPVLSQAIANGPSAQLPVAVSNFSFESPAGMQGTVAGVPGGWVPSNRNPYGVYNPPAGLYSKQANDILPSPAQGSQVLWIQSGNYVSQFLSNTLAANQTYTLSGAIGNRSDGYGIQLPSDQEYVYLLAGATIIAKNENLPHPAPGTFLPWTISYTTPASNFPSGSLEIRLGQSGAGQVHFDNIGLSASPAANTP